MTDTDRGTDPTAGASLADWLADAAGTPGTPSAPGPGRRRVRDGRAAASPRRRLWLAAALAWALLAGVAAAALTPERDTGGAAPGPGSPAEAGTGATTAAPPGHGPGGGPGAGTAATRPQVPGDLDRDVAAVGAVAAVAVRLALTGADEAAGTARYVDLALPSRLVWHGDIAVVTVTAVVLEGDGRGWGPPRVVRYAQPVRSGTGGPHPAGAPWALPAPRVEAVQPPLEPVDDPGARRLATGRLADAGYAEIEIVSLARHAELPGVLVATVEARAPGDARRGAHHVWLSAGPGGGVLGTTPEGGAGTGRPATRESHAPDDTEEERP